MFRMFKQHEVGLEFSEDTDTYPEIKGVSTEYSDDENSADSDMERNLTESGNELPMSNTTNEIDDVFYDAHDEEESMKDGIKSAIVSPKKNYSNVRVFIPSRPKILDQVQSTETTTVQEPITQVKEGITDNPLVLRRSERIKNMPPTIYKSYKLVQKLGLTDTDITTVDSVPPINFLRQVMNGQYGKDWIEAADKEFRGLEHQGCWDVVKIADLPNNTHILPTLVLFTQKFDGTKKCRFVVRGDLQHEWTETFSTVVFKNSIRLQITEAAIQDQELVSFDVVKAFINSPIKDGRKIYIRIPSGFVSNDRKVPPGCCFLLKRYLYGLKESPREWSNTWTEFLVSLNFTRSKLDWNMFIRKEKDQSITRLGVHVDDGLLSINDSYLNDTINKINKRFRIEFHGPVKNYLGVDFLRNRSLQVIGLNQGRYITKVGEKYPRSGQRKYTTPLPTDFDIMSLPENDECNPELTKQFQIITGICQYLVQTRPDIQYAVNVLSRFLQKPRNEHLELMKRVFYYLEDTKDMNLWYGKIGNEKFVVYSDASFAMDEKRKSRSGGIGLYYGSLVFSFSKLQTLVAQNSAEAEVMAMVETAKHALFNINLCQEMQMTLKLPIVLKTDSLSGIEIVRTTKNNARSKHMDLRYFSIRDWEEQGKIKLEWISKDKQIADLFTKPLGKNLFTRFRAMLPVGNMTTLKGCVEVINDKDKGSEYSDTRVFVKDDRAGLGRTLNLEKKRI